MPNGQTLSQLKLMPKADIVIRPDAITAKRIKLLSRLKEQHEIATCTVEGRVYESTRNKRVTNKETGEVSVMTVARRVRPWFYQDVSGGWFFELRNGATRLEIAKGLDVVMVGQPENLLATIATITNAVQRGELDRTIEKAGALSGKKKRSAVMKP
jgi:hypothetical protein